MRELFSGLLYAVSLDPMSFSYCNQPQVVREIMSDECDDWIVFGNEEHARKLRDSFENPHEHPIVKILINYSVEEI